MLPRLSILWKTICLTFSRQGWSGRPWKVFIMKLCILYVQIVELQTKVKTSLLRKLTQHLQVAVSLQLFKFLVGKNYKRMKKIKVRWESEVGWSPLLEWEERNCLTRQWIYSYFCQVTPLCLPVPWFRGSNTCLPSHSMLMGYSLDAVCFWFHICEWSLAWLLPTTSKTIWGVSICAIRLAKNTQGCPL